MSERTTKVITTHPNRDRGVSQNFMAIHPITVEMFKSKWSTLQTILTNCHVPVWALTECPQFKELFCIPVPLIHAVQMLNTYKLIHTHTRSHKHTHAIIPLNIIRGVIGSGSRASQKHCDCWRRLLFTRAMAQADRPLIASFSLSHRHTNKLTCQ